MEMGCRGGTRSLLLVHAFLFSVAVVTQARDFCAYTIYVKTGWLPKSGTNSVISATFLDAKGDSVHIQNLTEWGGLMGPDHDYYEWDEIDAFSGLADCVDGPTICGLNLTSDGSGSHHGWYCEYLEVTSAALGKPCGTHRFTIDQWLARDASPYSLTATRDQCAGPPAHRAAAMA